MNELSPKCRVTVIVPTMAAPERAASLRRAIESIRRSSTRTIVILTVVNGNRHDAGLCAWLRAQPDVRFEYVPMPSAPNAVLRGRELVQTPFFSTLDDDDEFLEGGIDRRLAAIQCADDIDIVVSNGYRNRAGVDATYFNHLHAVPTDPLGTLFECNWLNSCDTLYRTASVGPEYFSDYHPYVEWTWLAFRLAMAGKTISAVQEPTFRCNDTPASVSKSNAYADSILSLYQRMLALSPDARIAQIIRRRMGAAWHGRSVHALDRGRWHEALRFHFHSLCLPGRTRYLAYTRRVIPGVSRNTRSMSETP
jgi:hypothetical protein